MSPSSTGCTTVNPGFFNVGLDASVNTFSGTFSADDNIQIFQIDVGSANTPLTIQSFGYGGGADFTGSTITVPPLTPTGPLGGFATVLSLFDSTGSFITDSFFSTCGANAHTNPNTTACFDAGLSATVGAGTFYLALTQNNNYDSTAANLFSAPNVVNPGIFSQNGNPTFTSATAAGFCTAPFCDPVGNQMNGNYAIDIALGVPEPSLSALVGCVLMLALFPILRRRRASRL